jgi:hypothetical protein
MKRWAIDPREPLIWNNKGLAHEKLGWEEEALACFGKIPRPDRRPLFQDHQSAPLPVSSGHWLPLYPAPDNDRSA